MFNRLKAAAAKKRQEAQQEAEERPIITVVGAGAIRVDSWSLLQLPKVQAQIKAMRDIDKAKEASQPK